MIIEEGLPAFAKLAQQEVGNGGVFTGDNTFGRVGKEKDKGTVILGIGQQKLNKGPQLGIIGGNTGLILKDTRPEKRQSIFISRWRNAQTTKLRNAAFGKEVALGEQNHGDLGIIFDFGLGHDGMERTVDYARARTEEREDYQ